MKPLAHSASVHHKRAARLAAAGVALAVCMTAQGADAHKAKAKRAPAARYVAECSWDHPGLRPFMGDVVGAVDRYRDIPELVRTRLKERMAVRQYDEFVDIERDAIVGQRRYEPGIREMHFGDGRVCGVITRTKWTGAMRERGMVYCEGEHCILVPTVCRNVSRIRRKVFAEAPAPHRPDEPLPNVPEGGGYALYGWLTVQARKAEEPGWVGGPGPGVPPATPFLPPYSGGPGLPESALPVPEAPTWMMIGIGALLVVGVGRRKAKDTIKV
jgi:hypothetical protein